jgi:ABC-type transporter Mla MlaB component
MKTTPDETAAPQSRIVVSNDLTRDNIVRDTSLILDLTSVKRLDSKGFSLCIHISKKCIAQNISLQIKASPEAYRFFKATNLINHLNIIE